MAVDRLAWVDASKGICILLVVMFHATLHLVPSVGGGGIFDTVTRFSAPFRMPDFFLISGLFLSRRIRAPWVTYLDRKVVHFAYFYVLWMLITLAVLSPGLASGLVTFLEAFGASFIAPKGPLWFIYCLPLCFLIARFTAPLPGIVVWLAAAGLHVFNVPGEPVMAGFLTHYFVFFYTGYLAAPMIFTLAERAAAMPLVALLGLGFWGVLNGAVVFGSVDAFPGLSLALGIVGGCAVAVIAALLVRTRVGDGLIWLGARSIVVYLGFFIPLRVAEAYFLSLPGLPADAVIGLSIAAGVAVPLFLQALLSRLGFGGWLFERPHWARIDRPAAMPA
ncbi:MAG: acyltransferase family protein [Pseudomonadota bacterium]